MTPNPPRMANEELEAARRWLFQFTGSGSHHAKVLRDFLSSRPSPGVDEVEAARKMHHRLTGNSIHREDMARILAAALDAHRGEGEKHRQGLMTKVDEVAARELKRARRRGETRNHTRLAPHLADLLPDEKDERYAVYQCDCGMWGRWQDREKHHEGWCDRESHLVEVMPLASRDAHSAPPEAERPEEK